jgi:anhydro-N-acetylmuramic acid kinase
MLSAVSPWSDLGRRLRAGEAVVAGVLSGTSADGIDVALMRFPVASAGDLGAPQQLAFDTLPFAPGLAARVRALLDGAALDALGGLGELARLDRDLGRAFGGAVRALAGERRLAVELVGSHGQTVWHHDGAGDGPATLQLGCGDHVAEAAGCAVASDFRARDVAAGGEGAPLAPLADGALFAALERPGAVLNLGGIANWTLLGPRGVLSAFDTGPAGSLLDGLARRLLGRPFDEGGACARRGKVERRWVDELARHPFFERTPPKSTGRDTFGEAWVEAALARGRELGLARAEDLLAGAAELVARHAAEGLERFAPADFPSSAPIAVAGGGLGNAALREALERRLGPRVASSADFGVDPDAREALVFGVLAARCALGIPSTDPAATGARAGRVLGKLSHPACPA